MKAFIKKEWMEWHRTGRMLILVLIFILFGIMNPAMAKLTPWMMESLSDSLKGAGITTVAVDVDAMTSWTQFYKNIPFGIISFLLLCSGCFTAEYQRGTLITVVTKGLTRWKIVAVKALMMFLSWTVLFFLCFGITYGYNAFYWDNGIAGNLFFAAMCTWLFGTWLIALLVLFGTVADSSTQVLVMTGGVVIVAYILGLFHDIKKFLPVKLLDGMDLLYGTCTAKDYYACIVVAAVTGVLCVAVGMYCFGRKKL